MRAMWGTVDVPISRAALRAALIERRATTLAVYADLPESHWVPATFPYADIVNPPLWEMAHIGWFAEFFGLRWQPNDVTGSSTASIWEGADALLDSRIIPHRERWTRTYPPKSQLFDYLAATLERLIDNVASCPEPQLDRARLALLHEDMHVEALLMTLRTLNLPLPAAYSRSPLAGAAGDISFEGGELSLGDSDRTFRFDNEMPGKPVNVAPYSIMTQPVSAEELVAFRESADYRDAGLWGDDGRAWLAQQTAVRDQADGYAAMHVSWYEARAYCRSANRRLPTEAEWEFAARHSAAFRQSCGHVWEWTSSPFEPFPGFAPGAYADYSAPWFGNHTVLRGGSFVTEDRLRYPQYRNFYTPGRIDMFCGFRTCAID